MVIKQVFDVEFPIFLILFFLHRPTFTELTFKFLKYSKTIWQRNI